MNDYVVTTPMLTYKVFTIKADRYEVKTSGYDSDPEFVNFYVGDELVGSYPWPCSVQRMDLSDIKPVLERR